MDWAREYVNPFAWGWLYVAPAERDRIHAYGRKHVFRDLQRHFEQAFE